MFIYYRLSKYKSTVFPLYIKIPRNIPTNGHHPGAAGQVYQISEKRQATWAALAIFLFPILGVALNLGIVLKPRIVLKPMATAQPSLYT